jgi:hypothetical protein
MIYFKVSYQKYFLQIIFNKSFAQSLFYWFQTPIVLILSVIGFIELFIVYSN